MRSKGIGFRVVKACLLIGVFVLSPRVFAQPAETEILFGVQVLAPALVKHDGREYRIIAAQSNFTAGSLRSLRSHNPADPRRRIQLSYLRPLINLDVYAVEGGTSQKTPIQDIWNQDLLIEVRITLSAHDLEMILAHHARPSLYYWDAPKRVWVPAILSPEIYDYAFDEPERTFRFRIRSWCIDDRGIAAGG